MAAGNKNFWAKTVDVPRYSRLFEGKEICVINGEEKLKSQPNQLTKGDIERILMTHSAKIVQNPSENKTFCIIVGYSNTAKVQSYIASRKYDITTVDWFRRATQEINWSGIVSWYPWELLSSRRATADKISENYDMCHDSYFEDATKESLMRSLDKVSELHGEVEFTPGDYSKLEKKLFNNDTGSYSIFKDIVGYFVDPSDGSRFALQFMRGKVSDEIDASTTHIFINDDCVVDRVDLYTKVNSSTGIPAIIVKSQWIDECFEINKLLPLTNFIC